MRYQSLKNVPLIAATLPCNLIVIFTTCYFVCVPTVSLEDSQTVPSRTDNLCNVRVQCAPIPGLSHLWHTEVCGIQLVEFCIMVNNWIRRGWIRAPRGKELMTEEMEEDTTMHMEDEGTVPEDIESEEMLDDGAIVERIEMPRANPDIGRMVITLIIIVALIMAFRLLQGPGGKFEGQIVATGGGNTYAAGDVIAIPFDEPASLNIDVSGAGMVEIFPGTSLRLDEAEESESCRLTLIEGKVVLNMTVPNLKVVVEAANNEVNTIGARYFVELWEGNENYRVLVGVYEGKAGIVTERGKLLGLSAGDAVYFGKDLTIHPIVPSITDWPGKVGRLDGWVFPCLYRQEPPSLASLIGSICRQAGVKSNFPDTHPSMNIQVPTEHLGREAVRAGEILDKLARAYGFSYGVQDNELQISLLDNARHLALIGEWAIFSQPGPHEIGWPQDASGTALGADPGNLAEIATRRDAPVESRIGALLMLQAGREFGGDEYIEPTFDSEINIAFDPLSPMGLKRIAFDDLYGGDDAPAEKIVPLLKKGDVLIARNYFMCRLWGPPAWMDTGDLNEIDEYLRGVSYSAEDDAGRFYIGLVEGIENTVEMLKWFEGVYFSGDDRLGMEVVHQLQDIAYANIDTVDPLFVGKALKRVMSLGSDSGIIVALDGIRAMGGRDERDVKLLMLIDNLATTPSSQVTSYAAYTIGYLMRMFHEPEDEKLVDEMIPKIRDPLSEDGAVTLWVLGIADGLDTKPGLVTAELIEALDERVGLVIHPEDQLWLLRLLRVQRIELEGAAGLSWVRGEAVQVFGQLLALKDPNYLERVVLTLGLTEQAPSGAGAEPADIRGKVDQAFLGFAVHTDPKLRLLSVRYLANNKPMGREEALAVLADDEYVVIAEEARKALGTGE